MSVQDETHLERELELAGILTQGTIGNPCSVFASLVVWKRKEIQIQFPDADLLAVTTRKGHI